MATIELYTILTCANCVAYIETLRNFSINHNYTLKVYDIDSDPIESFAYLKRHKDCITGIPFIVIYDINGQRINCISGVHTYEYLTQQIKDE